MRRYAEVTGVNSISESLLNATQAAVGLSALDNISEESKVQSSPSR